MIAEIGHIALILALVVAGFQAVLPMVGAARNQGRLMVFADRAATAQFILIAFSFACLTLVFLVSDFSVKLVASHSHSAKPLIYKISGVWANHEGSMLLWVLILALYGAMVPVFGKRLPTSLKARALSVQAMLGVGFIGFLLFTSNPFERLSPTPLQGNGLNPLLQDPGLALHPPFLYLGYVGFSISFSFAVAALIEGRIDAVWARWLRPWVLTAWSFLTIGIALGSFWAYYELGWGGWWMWDPVENVSFMPWLAGTALLHSIMVLSTRHSLPSWTVLLAIATFSLSLIGTFVVRSGVLVSVHAFATDPERGVYILALLAFTTGAALALYALRARTLSGAPSLALSSRGGALVLNNIVLVGATLTVFIGTFYPLFMDALSGEKISVGAPYFNLTFGPIMALLIIFMGVGPLLKWREDSLSRLKPFFIKAVVLAVVITGLTYLFGRSVLGGLGLALAAYLAFATLTSFAKRIRWGEVSREQSLSLLRAQPAASYAFLGAHIGLAICAAGIVSMSVWSDNNAKALLPGESVMVAGYSFTMGPLSNARRDNYEFMGSDITISKNGRAVKTVHTQRRYYPVRSMLTTEAGLHLSLRHTLFASISETNQSEGVKGEDRRWIIRAYYHPYVVWIWLGALLMALSGFVSLFDRRLREAP